MDRFLDKSLSRSRYLTWAAEAALSTDMQHTDKMAATEITTDGMETDINTLQNSPAPRQLDGED